MSALTPPLCPKCGQVLTELPRSPIEDMKTSFQAMTYWHCSECGERRVWRESEVPYRFPIIVLAGRQSYESVGLAAQVSEVHLDNLGQFIRRKLIGEIPLNAPFMADYLMTLEAAKPASLP